VGGGAPPAGAGGPSCDWGPPPGCSGQRSSVGCARRASHACPQSHSHRPTPTSPCRATAGQATKRFTHQLKNVGDYRATVCSLNKLLHDLHPQGSPSSQLWCLVCRHVCMSLSLNRPSVMRQLLIRTPDLTAPIPRKTYSTQDGELSESSQDQAPLSLRK
jgi:hypothetical protein